ncbi:MAG: DivIVA domain-containing protein [Eubacteriales bacterium]
MAISPKDIYEKKFKSSFRGYSEKEVDEFLDKIIVEFQSIIMERDECLKELEQLKSTSEESKNKNLSADAAIADKLLSAQKSADLILKQSKNAGKFIIEDAQKKAQKFIDIINLQVLDAKCNIQALKNLTVDYKANFQRFLTEQVDAFNDHYTKIMEIFDNAGSLDEPNDSVRISEISDMKNTIDVDAIEDLLKPKDDTIDIESTIGESVPTKAPESPAENTEPKTESVKEEPSEEYKADDEILSQVSSGNIVWEDEEPQNEEQGYSLKTDEEQEELKKLIDEIIGD